MAKKKNTLSSAAKAKKSGYSASIEELKKKVAKDDVPRKRLNVEIPEPLHTELKLYATRHGASMTDIVEGLIRGHLEGMIIRSNDHILKNHLWSLPFRLVVKANSLCALPITLPQRRPAAQEWWGQAPQLRSEGRPPAQMHCGKTSTPVGHASAPFREVGKEAIARHLNGF